MVVGAPFEVASSVPTALANLDAAIAILVGAAVGPLSGGDPGQAVVLSTWLALLAAGILLLPAINAAVTGVVVAK